MKLLTKMKMAEGTREESRCPVDATDAHVQAPDRSVRTIQAPSKTLAALLADAGRGAAEYVTGYEAGRGAE